MSKRIVLIILLAASFYSILAEADVSQDERNKMFLQKLDENLVSTIQILEAFNTIANNMIDVEGSDFYRQFLMEMSLECGRLRNTIDKAQKAAETEREIEIRLLIYTIRSDIELEQPNLTREQDISNREQLAAFQHKIERELARLRNGIIREEKNIKEDFVITRTYLGYHSMHYIHSLLLSYLKPSGYLSIANRDYLTQVVTAIMDSL